MQKLILPFQFSKSLSIPASKSILQRLITLSAFCTEKTTIKNPHYCNDVKTAINIVKSIGANVKEYPDSIEIQGIKPDKHNTSIHIDADESGLSARMFALLLPVLYEEVIITAKNTLLHRSIHSLITILEQAGCTVQSKNSKFPLHIKGFANYQNIYLDTIDTSQIITGLLYASVISQKECTIYLNKIISTPYIQISLNIAQQFGITIHSFNHFKHFHIPPQQTIKPINTTAEGDWSNAAFFIVAAALSGECYLHQLNPHSLQGDKIITDILKNCGARIQWTEQNILHVQKSPLKPFVADLTHYPDLFPPLSILAAGIKGTSVLKAVSRLSNKESSREKALLALLNATGIDAYIKDDALYIFGKGKLEGTTIHSFNDHRIAMAAATAATISNTPILIENAEAVNKSYPTFFEDLIQ